MPTQNGHDGLDSGGLLPKMMMPRAHAVHILPQGFLLDSPPYHAIWYFLACAHRMLARTPNQIVVTDEEDKRGDMLQQATTISRCWGITLADMFAPEVWKRAQAEANDCDLPIDNRVSGFINSGGKQHANTERDPDSHATSDE